MCRRPLDASSLAEGSVRTSRVGDHVSLKSRSASQVSSWDRASSQVRRPWSVASCASARGAFVVFGVNDQGRHMGRRLMANAEKTAVIEELTGKFNESSGAVLTEYRGLTVAQLSELRGNLKGNATFTVTKNTLAKVAATNAGVGDEVASMLSGPSAIAFVDGDVAQAAKGLLDFAKANPLLIIKGGVLDGKALTPAEVGKLADLEPREVLLAKLAGAMKASMANAAATFNALPTQMALLADALRAKVEASTPQADEAPATTDTAAPADVTEALDVDEAADTE